MIAVMGIGSPFPHVDPRTLILISGLMGGLMAVVLYFLQRNYPSTMRGLREWTLGTVCLFLAGLAAATRGYLHDLVAFVLPHFLILCGVYFQYHGSQLFFGQPGHRTRCRLRASGDAWLPSTHPAAARSA